ncbi:MAG: histidinol-phosphate transaminase [Elusimicrobiota bacterium]
MTDTFPEARKEIKNMIPYKAGRGPDDIRKEYNLSRALKLSSNENVWGPSKNVFSAIEKEMQKMHMYPDPDSSRLTSVLADKHNVGRENIITGNGSDEIIELLAKAYLSPKDTLLSSAGSFIRYKAAANLMGARFIEAARENFTVSVNNLRLKTDQSVKLIFIDNPSNPSGTYINARKLNELLNFIEKRKKKTLLVIDEAYYEYAKKESDYESALKYINKEAPVMILRTFSKAYGLAGLRIGYAVAPARIINVLKKIKPPFNTNRLAQAGALAALADENHLNHITEKTAEEKNFLYKELDKSGFNYVPSAANFVLMEVGKEHAESLCIHLEKRGIIVRPLSAYFYPGHLRFTIGKREHNIKLIKGIKDYFALREK